MIFEVYILHPEDSFPSEGENSDNKWPTFIDSCMNRNTLDFYTYDNPSFMYVVISVSIM